MGRHHGRVLDQLDGVDLIGAVDPTLHVEAAPPGLPIMRCLEELLAVGVDYCVVATPTETHAEVGLAVAAAGVHALIEKPLAPTGPAARRLAAAFADAGLVGAVGHVERYNPALRAARQRIDDGELGAVYQISTRRQGPFPGRVRDVGVIKDLATHDIDVTTWMTQQSYGTVAARATHRSGSEFEDMVAVVGTLSDRTVTNHVINWLSPFKERVTIMTGEKGTLIADTLTADLTFYANGSAPNDWAGLQPFRGMSEGDVIRYAIHKEEPLVLEHIALRDTILDTRAGTNEQASIVPMADSVGTVEVAEAMIRSCILGETVDLGGSP